MSLANTSSPRSQAALFVVSRQNPAAIERAPQRRARRVKLAPRFWPENNRAFCDWLCLQVGPLLTDEEHDAIVRTLEIFREHMTGSLANFLRAASRAEPDYRQAKVLDVAKLRRSSHPPEAA